MKIGSIVSYNTLGTEDTFALGRVIAHETYVDENGRREWWYVRWFSDHGKPDGEPMKHAAAELTVKPPVEKARQA